MENDLLFTVIEKQQWKSLTESGKFRPITVDELGYIECIFEKDLETYLNKQEGDHTELMLILIDRLRIKDSIKTIKDDGVTKIRVSGELDLDAIIDKITLKRDSKKRFSFSIKHFD